MDPEALLRDCLLLDLETAPDGRLLKVGAVLGPRTERPSPASAPAVLGELAAQARCVLGHNLIAHDLSVLRASNPHHPILALPVLDTLILSPLCFPENPYHRLVKDYKLVRESLNDPVADALLAAQLFRDETAALDGMRQAAPGLFDLLHFLLAHPDPSESPDTRRFSDGMALLFHAFGTPRPGPDTALRLASEFVRPHACRNAPIHPGLIATRERRLTLAFVLAWLRVAGSNSILPPWVRLRHPDTLALVSRLRDSPCGDPACDWCRRSHDPRTQLREFFHHDDFRPVPANPTGGSLQRDIVTAGLRGESLLAILPTGGGKSICYQLPALVRNQRLGALTVVLSPLQALMKDQVDGLVRRTGTPAAAALYGMLTPPERGDVLRRIRLGDVAVLYVSPEQLRNPSFHEAIAHRDIACWVFDEAHCLSKWGHDFRPDYLYAGRFIREFAQSQGAPIPPIACFTATAKREVRDEILAHFRSETGRELLLFEGGVDRDNLDFEVLPIATPTKLSRLHDLLSERLGDDATGSAIVFHARRSAAEEAAAYLVAKGWRAAHFHAGLAAPEKKRIQDAFLAGETRVICATNAFGMGIDKEDVRLVIHADTPGSLENYLQEAGRAGRDGARARCVLLYDEADCEAQFRLGAASEISRRDIAGILRTVRKYAARGGRDEVILTAGEILRDEEAEPNLAPEDRNADTKVRAALAWLERAGFLHRDENVTRVFQARPLVHNLAEADARIAALNLPASQRPVWRAILRELLNAPDDGSLTVDALALLPECAALSRAHPATAGPEYLSGRILATLGSMAQAGLLRRDTLLNAFVRHKTADHSGIRLERVTRTEAAMIDLLALEAPDPEGWLPLSLRHLHARLAEAGHTSSREMVRDLLRSLAEDGRGFGSNQGSIELSHWNQDTYRVRVRRSWTAIAALADKRRRVAALALQVILARIPPEAPASAERLVPFAFEDIRLALDQDLLLRSELRDFDAAIARALLYLHEQHVLQLQQGLAIFRSAMTLRLRPERRGDRYQTADFQPLEHHYHERILQVHVMGEYARRGLRHIRDARDLVLAYFQLGKEAFLHRFLPGHAELLTHATTAASFQRIVTDLANPAQIRIVTAPIHRNLLVLAGPGSGKTRTVVHRCAYLLRVARVPARAILVCCFNRAAALELRRRLQSLVGDDARGVTIQTYHGLALRLLGRPAAQPNPTPGATLQEPDFNALITDAVRLLQGKETPPGFEPDEVRDRLLAGFQHILVDEYQDIDAPQYELISALAGRTQEDADQRLSILAVGDDDQNIYTFRGANVQFIRRFQLDYQADIHHLVENYRATRHLIDTTNRLIAANEDRMKSGHPIRIDHDRAMFPAGGPMATTDPLTEGRVQVLRCPSPDSQPDAVLAELARLKALGLQVGSRMAILSRTHRDLAAIRAACESNGIPIRWPASRHSLPPLRQIRELDRFLAALHGHLPQGLPPLPALVRASDLLLLAQSLAADVAPDHPWVRFLAHQLDAWKLESADAELPPLAAAEYLHEAFTEARTEFNLGDGVTLSTVHAAKGTEFDHVLLTGSWVPKPDGSDLEDLRRAFYVGMTRARQTLTVLDHGHDPRRLTALPASPQVFHRTPPVPDSPPRPTIAGYEMLGLEDLLLGYAGFFPAPHPIHTHLARLQPGDTLTPREARSASGEPQIDLLDSQNLPVARLSRRAAERWTGRLGTVQTVRILAMVRRRASQTRDESYRTRLQTETWELPITEWVLHSSAP